MPIGDSSYRVSPIGGVTETLLAGQRRSPEALARCPLSAGGCEATLELADVARQVLFLALESLVLLGHGALANFERLFPQVELDEDTSLALGELGLPFLEPLLQLGQLLRLLRQRLLAGFEASSPVVDPGRRGFADMRVLGLESCLARGERLFAIHYPGSQSVRPPSLGGGEPNIRCGLLSGQRPVAVGIVFHLSDPFSAHPRQVAIPRWGFVRWPDVARRDPAATRFWLR